MNNYDYLLEYTEKDRNLLMESVYDITELIRTKQIDESASKEFIFVVKTIIQRGDFTSFSCVNLLRDIMTDDLYDFLLGELKKCMLRNEPLAIEIMKIITCDNFHNYYSYLESVKNNSEISDGMKNLINIILNFEKGIVKVFSFPVINQKNRDSTELVIDWS